MAELALVFGSLVGRSLSLFAKKKKKKKGKQLLKERLTAWVSRRDSMRVGDGKKRAEVVSYRGGKKPYFKLQ